MHALRIRETIDPLLLLLLREEGSYVSDMDAGVEIELMNSCNCMSARAKFVISIVIVGAD